MKAPETKWPVDVAALGTFSEAWWRELKESLAERGVDLDALGTFSEAQWRELKESLAERGFDLDAKAQWRELTGRAVSASDTQAPFNAVVRYGTFSEKQWRQVEHCLAAVGVKLDTQTVEELAGPREWWGWEPGKDYTPAQVLLRRALQEWAYAAAMAHGMKLKTPKWWAEKLREEVAALQRTRAMLDPTYVGPGLPTDEVLDARIKRRRALQAAMMQEIAERREYIAELEAVGSNSKENARTEGNAYWDMLATKWLEVTRGRAIKYRRQYLLQFLHACSQPLLPKLIEQESDQKFTKEELEQELGRRLDNFIKNFFHPKRPPKSSETRKRSLKTDA